MGSDKDLNVVGDQAILRECDVECKRLPAVWVEHRVAGSGDDERVVDWEIGEIGVKEGLS